MTQAEFASRLMQKAVHSLLRDGELHPTVIYKTGSSKSVMTCFCKLVPMDTLPNNPLLRIREGILSLKNDGAIWICVIMTAEVSLSRSPVDDPNLPSGNALSLYIQSDIDQTSLVQQFTRDADNKPHMVGSVESTHPPTDLMVYLPKNAC